LKPVIDQNIFEHDVTEQREPLMWTSRVCIAIKGLEKQVAIDEGVSGNVANECHRSKELANRGNLVWQCEVCVDVLMGF